MSEEKKELSTIENDVLAVSFLKQNGKSVQSPFSRDIFLMNTMINGAMHMEEIHKKAAKLHEGERVQLILEPKNKGIHCKSGCLCCYSSESESESSPVNFRISSISSSVMPI